MHPLYFVSCSAGAKTETALWDSLRRLGVEDDQYRFFEHNRRGLSSCYNEVLDSRRGRDEILVLAHDDVTIADLYIREKLNEAARAFNVIGLVGSSYFTLHLNHFAWPAFPGEHLSGAVEHPLPNGLTVWSVYGPVPRTCVVMDGLLLAIDLAAIDGVRFDEQFTFNLYDLDFCLSAYFAGKTLGTANVYVQHASLGEYQTSAYQAALDAFRRKWQPRIDPQT